MIELAAMLRLVPYVLVLIIGIKKGFPRLTLVAFILLFITLINFTFKPDADVRAIFSSIFSFVLLLHALDLKPRKK